MKNKIVTFLCIMTILITTCIAAANSDGVQHATNSNNQSVLIEQLYKNAYGDSITNDTNPLFPGQLRDRYVSVQNVSASTYVFIRTIFAFEAGDLTLDEFHRDFKIKMNYGDNAEWQWLNNNEWKPTRYNNKEYFVTSATYKTALAPKNTTQNSLLKFGLTTDATNETVNQFNDSYTLMVCSQAVQADGWKIDGKNVSAEMVDMVTINRILDKAFGEIDSGYQADWGSVTTQ